MIRLKVSDKFEGNDVLLSSFTEKVIEKIAKEIIDGTYEIVHITRYDGVTPGEYKNRIMGVLESLNLQNTIIIIESYIHHTDTEPFSYNKADDLEMDVEMLKSLGFLDIDFYVQYKYGISLIYNNELGKKIYDYMRHEYINMNEHLYDSMNVLLKVDFSKSDCISTKFRIISDTTLENDDIMFEEVISLNDINTGIILGNEYVNIYIKYDRLADLVKDKIKTNMIPKSRTNDMSMMVMTPGTLSIRIKDKLKDEITNVILLDLCSTSVQVHWRRHCLLDEHTVASTQYSVQNLMKGATYKNNVLQLLMYIPDIHDEIKPIYIYNFKDMDIQDIDLWQSTYINKIKRLSIGKPTGIYCETTLDKEKNMKHYKFIDFETGKTTYEDNKYLPTTSTSVDMSKSILDIETT